MTEMAVIDLGDKANPPPDDPSAAPYGYRWDTRKKEWSVKRSAGGRKSGAAWFGKNILGIEEPDPAPESDGPADYMQGFEKQFQDPEPAYAKAPTPRVSRARKSVPKVSKKIQDDMAGSLGLIGALLGPPLMSADPYCAGAFFDNFETITAACLPLMCRSATIVGFFTDTGSDWMLWFKLAIALSPVTVAVGKHHILRSVEIQQDKESGELFVVPRDLSEYATTEEEASEPA
jgi:hypothetical protein